MLARELPPPEAGARDERGLASGYSVPSKLNANALATHWNIIITRIRAGYDATFTPAAFVGHS
jgi:hypothetical protein